MRYMFVSKFDAMGNPKWGRGSGMGGDSEGDDIKVDGTGHIFATGTATPPLDDNLRASGNGVYVIAFDADGNRF